MIYNGMIFGALLAAAAIEHKERAQSQAQWHRRQKEKRSQYSGSSRSTSSYYKDPDLDGTLPSLPEGTIESDGRMINSEDRDNDRT